MVNSVKPDDLLVWKLVQLPDLESWTWKSGKVVLTADGEISTPHVCSSETDTTPSRPCGHAIRGSSM
jgi:hypothetical protein